MSRYHSHINTSLKLLGSYKGQMPFAVYIKRFFSQEKKYGSKDRKQISALCYSFFRVGLAMNKILTEENLLKAYFLVNNKAAGLIADLKPGWADATTLPVEDKIKLIDDVDLQRLFPFQEELHASFRNESFYRSFLIQPDLFVRIRSPFKKQVLKKINDAGIEYQLLNNGSSVQLPAGTNIDQLLETGTEVVIQDHNSQQVLNYIGDRTKQITDAYPLPVSVWDCCAASGGKSILLNDLLPNQVQLTVSDIRQSIISNLHERFAKAAIKNYTPFVADLADSALQLPVTEFDIIICDAPCTGSGTWSRTPEQLYFFNPAAIEQYADKQQKITNNICRYLKPDGLLIYITCSVFTKENEAVVEHILQQKNMQLLEMNYLHGLDKKADSMFTAVLKKLPA